MSNFLSARRTRGLRLRLSVGAVSILLRPRCEAQFDTGPQCALCQGRTVLVSHSPCSDPQAIAGTVPHGPPAQAQAATHGGSEIAFSTSIAAPRGERTSSAPRSASARLSRKRWNKEPATSAPSPGRAKYRPRGVQTAPRNWIHHFRRARAAVTVEGLGVDTRGPAGARTDTARAFSDSRDDRQLAIDSCSACAVLQTDSCSSRLANTSGTRSATPWRLRRKRDRAREHKRRWRRT